MMAPESACKRGGMTSLSYIPSCMGCVSACFILKIKVQTWKVKPGNRFMKIKWINLICLWKLAFETRATGSQPRWHWIYGKLATLPPTFPKPPSRDCSSDPLGRSVESWFILHLFKSLEKGATGPQTLLAQHFVQTWLLTSLNFMN